MLRLEPLPNQDFKKGVREDRVGALRSLRGSVDEDENDVAEAEPDLVVVAVSEPLLRLRDVSLDSDQVAEDVVHSDGVLRRVREPLGRLEQEFDEFALGLAAGRVQVAEVGDRGVDVLLELV